MQHQEVELDFLETDMVQYREAELDFLETAELLHLDVKLELLVHTMELLEAAGGTGIVQLQWQELQLGVHMLGLVRWGQVAEPHW